MPLQTIAMRLGPQRLRLLHLVFSVLLAGFLITTYALSDAATRGSETLAQEINLSGRQRMLSQRIVFLATSDQQIPERRDLLVAAVTDFRTAHERLTTSPFIDEQLRGLYFTDTLNRPAVDSMVRYYINGVQQLMNDEADNPEQLRSELATLALGPLLTGLDQAVREFERLARENVREIRRTQTLVLVLGLLVLLCATLIVFLPNRHGAP